MLTDSTRALDSPCSNAPTICARWVATVLASATNAGMRQRRAHERHASSSATPWGPLSLKTSRSSSFSREARYSGRLTSAMRASLACWRRVRSWGFFHSANLACLSALAKTASPPLRAVFQTSRRTSSSASVAHSGDVERVQAHDRLRAAARDHAGDPAGRIRAHMGELAGVITAEGVEEALQGGLVVAGRGPHQPAGVVIDHHVTYR